MKIVLLLVAAFFLVVNLITFKQLRSFGYLFAALGWACMVGYYFVQSPTLLYVAFGLILVSMFTRRRGQAQAPADTDTPASTLPASSPGTALEHATEAADDEAEIDWEEELHARWSYDPVEPCTPAAGVVVVPVTFRDATTFATEDGGNLSVGPGTVDVAVQFAFLYRSRPEDDFPTDTLTCTHRLADSEGTVWQAETVISFDDLNTLLERAFGVCDLNGESAPSPTILRYAQAPAAWRQAFADACLAADIHSLDDSRSGTELEIDGIPFAFIFKYQCPIFDLALLREADPAQSRIVVRVSDLCNAYVHEEVVNELPPFVFAVAPGEVLLRNSTFYYDADGENQELDAPQPVTFRRTGDTGAPQPGVVFSR